MRLSCLQEDISWGLGIVERAVTPLVNLPMTKNILLETDQTRLKLVAINPGMAITCWIGAKVEEEGTITVPAELLTEFINSLPKDKVDIAMLPKTKNLTVGCACFEAHIGTMNAKDFPPILTVEQGIETSIEVEALRQAITHVVFTAAIEESRPVLTGVNAIFEGNTLTLVAADGFRLAVYKVNLAKPVSQKVEIIIPAQSLKELNRLISGQIKIEVDHPFEIDVKHTATSEQLTINALENVIRKDNILVDTHSPVEIAVNPLNNTILFKFKNIELISRLIRGTFPQYQQFISQNTGNKVTVSKAEFIRAIRAATIFACDGIGIVRMFIKPGNDLTPGKVTIGAHSEIGDNVSEIDAKVTGSESKIAFNHKYLNEVLTVISEALVTLEVTDSYSPCVIKTVGSDNYIHVIVPMTVKW